MNDKQREKELATALAEERRVVAQSLADLTEERFGRVYDKLDVIITQTTRTNGTVQKHDGEIRSLQNWRWYVIGIATVLAAFGYEILSRI